MGNKRKEDKKNKNREESCPLCQVSKETIKILKEKGKKGKPKRNPQNNGGPRNN